MTTHEAFSADEWATVLQGPPMAGLMVLTAAHGGTFRETFAMSKAYVDARSQHGQSELLDEIVATKPKTDHTRYDSPEALRRGGVEHLHKAVALLEQKATPDEVEGYRHFVLDVAGRVAAAHREDGQAVSPAEAEALEQISNALAAG